MMSFLQKIKKHLQQSSGDAVLTFFILAIPVLLICVGFASDTAKTTAVRNNYSSIAQNNANEAIKTLNSKGYLGVNSAKKFSEGYFKDSKDLGYQACTTTILKNGKEVKLPYMEITLNSDTNNFVYTIDPTTDTNKLPLPGNHQYERISINVYDSSPNYFAIFPMQEKCQIHLSHVESVKFGSNEDIVG